MTGRKEEYSLPLRWAEEYKIKKSKSVSWLWGRGA